LSSLSDNKLQLVLKMNLTKL